MVFTRNLKHRRKRLGEAIDVTSDAFCDLQDSSQVLAGPCSLFQGLQLLPLATYMLIDQHDPDILPLLRKVCKGVLDGGGFGFGVNDEEIALGVGRFCYVLYDRSKISIGIAIWKE